MPKNNLSIRIAAHDKRFTETKHKQNLLERFYK